jgi:tagaturonate reductase
MIQLSKKNLSSITSHPDLSIPGDEIFQAPEKVLQFGTGILLRGLPDYFIDKANKKGIFNGRIVVIKSTNKGGTDAFEKQNGLYTICVRGLESGNQVNETIINGAISRVLSASAEWKDVLACAHNPELQLIISNTTEMGIVFVEDRIDQSPPISFPGKLLAFLYERFIAFGASDESGMVIVPTELIVGNGDQLRSIVLQLAAWNQLDKAFIKWLENSNHFCNSLVDRIVPGAMNETDSKVVEQAFGYKDELMIMAEPFRLWAIESSNQKVKEVLSFAATDKGLVIAEKIEKFRDLKLRLLNGTHSFTCAISLLAGFETVKQGMDNEQMLAYVKQLMTSEIAFAIEGDLITYDEALTFAAQVVDRFRNPFLEHKWTAISANYTAKMRMRNIPLFEKYFNKTNKIPPLMAFGFAAYIVFMNCRESEDHRYYHGNGRRFLIDDEAAGYFARQWAKPDRDEMVSIILSDRDLWGYDLARIPGFAQVIAENIRLIESDGVLPAMASGRLHELTA